MRAWIIHARASSFDVQQWKAHTLRTELLINSFAPLINIHDKGKQAKSVRFVQHNLWNFSLHGKIVSRHSSFCDCATEKKIVLREEKHNDLSQEYAAKDEELWAKINKWREEGKLNVKRIFTVFCRRCRLSTYEEEGKWENFNETMHNTEKKYMNLETCEQSIRNFRLTSCRLTCFTSCRTNYRKLAECSMNLFTLVAKLHGVGKSIKFAENTCGKFLFLISKNLHDFSKGSKDFSVKFDIMLHWKYGTLALMFQHFA